MNEGLQSDLLRSFLESRAGRLIAAKYPLKQRPLPPMLAQNLAEQVRASAARLRILGHTADADDLEKIARDLLSCLREEEK